MRLIILSFLVVLTSYASADVPGATPNASTVTDERRAVIAKENFDACQLRTPEETWEYWGIVHSDKDRETVKSTPYGDLIQFHHGWGTGIRNRLCLWKGGPLQSWFIEREVSHPDSMSQILIELYWARLNGCNPQEDDFARADYPTNPEFLRCPATVEVGTIDYRKVTPKIVPKE